jgi:hypothetical protein
MCSSVYDLSTYGCLTRVVHSLSLSKYRFRVVVMLFCHIMQKITPVKCVDYIFLENMRPDKTF